MDWALANLDAPLDALVVAGCSSGAVGAQLWAAKVLELFRFSRAAVLADSYVGLFPGAESGSSGAGRRSSAEGSVLRDFGSCSTGLFSHLGGACEEQRLTVPLVFEARPRRALGGRLLG